MDVLIWKFVCEDLVLKLLVVELLVCVVVEMLVFWICVMIFLMGFLGVNWMIIKLISMILNNVGIIRSNCLMM